MNLSAVPVIYYHSVKYKKNYNWVHPHITMPLNIFHKHLRWIYSLGMKTFFMDDLYFHMKGTRKLPFNSLIINFDDGYLDNFTFAFPLLKKFNLRATIWLNPAFVDSNSNEVRPTLEDYWNNKITLDELNRIDGFLNWEEMRQMEKSGVIDIQSHTMTHTKYPISDKIIDFVAPNTKIDWLYWNLFPDDRPNFLTEPKYKIPLGHPIYENERGNIAIKYEEDGGVTSEIVNFVNENGGKKLFEKEKWKSELLNITDDIKRNGNVAYKEESKEEYRERIQYELMESKRTIEKNLGKTVNHVCWPFGGWNETTISLANECGYLTNTARGQKNVFGKEKFTRVDRFALDNPKYQETLFYPYSIFKLIEYKF